MVNFMNDTGVTYGIVLGLNELTGDYFLSMMLIVLMLVVICLGLQMPLEISAIFVLPFLLACFAFVPNFVAVTGVTLIYLGIILAKYLMSFFK